MDGNGMFIIKNKNALSGGKDGEFEVSSFECRDAHNGNNLFNFIFINSDSNHKARYEKVFYSLVRYG